MSRFCARLPLASGLAALILGCQDPLGVHTALVTRVANREGAVGEVVYDLRRVSGTSPTRLPTVSGSISITSNNLAELRTSYQIDAIGGVEQSTYSGMYRQVDSIIEFSFHGCTGQGVFVLPARGQLEPDGTLRLTYPLDARIVEVYQRRQVVSSAEAAQWMK